MDADCLIKLTKADLKEVVCRNFSVFIPQRVKEEVVDNAQGYPDAAIIQENFEKQLLHLEPWPSSSKKGEEAVLTIFQQGRFEAVCSDDRRFIRRLHLFKIPYITPAVFIALLLKNDQLTLPAAREKLEALSPFVSEEEYRTLKRILKDWRTS